MVPRIATLAPILLVSCGGGGPSASLVDAEAHDGSKLTRDAGADVGVPFDAYEADVAEGPIPLGASYDPVAKVFHFRVRSANATRLELDLFEQPLDAPAKLTQVLAPEGSASTWSTTISASRVTAAGVGSTVYYGYRAWGPNWTYDPMFTPGSALGFIADVDGNGNRFNPNKLLIDPYTREISHDPESPGHMDSSVYAVGSNRTIDSAPSASKGIVIPQTSFDFGTKPSRPLASDIIYEVHVRGLTNNDPGTPASCRGTYAAAGAKASYLKTLGVTALELLPIEETQNDQNDLDDGTGGQNYWGYSTLADFAPDRRYACDKSPGGPTREFAAMVKALHEQGIKVLLDVVYNHTAEGGGASLLSWRGLDNASYYELDPGGQGFVDNTGIGANFNSANPIAADLIIDSLTYWTGTLGVDGFRFDLAAVLGNTCTADCFTYSATDPAGVLERAVTALPAATPLIAEPWGIGNGTYQLGNFPKGWSEWNGQFRDTLRMAQNLQGIDAIPPSSLVDDLSGSPSLFSAARGPIASINYLVSHDGFTLHDLYSCDEANNTQAWPYGPSSGGTTDNYSWNQGGVASLEEQAARTGLSLVSVAAGVPMITGGDEIGRTIQCNNNPYNIDSVGNWLDWESADTSLQAFTTSMFAFRSAHSSLRPTTFRTGTDHNGNGLPDIGWLEPSGSAADGGYLSDSNNDFIAFRVDGTETGDVVASIYVAYNASPNAITVTVPSPLKSWFVSCDTSATLPSGGYCAKAGSEAALEAATYVVGSRSVAILIDRG